MLMNTSPLYGLISQNHLVPLTQVSVHTRLDHHLHHVTVKQRYENQEDQPIEATYLFPLETDSAVNGFTIKIDDRIIQGEVKEREEAFETYDDALMEGHGAFLLDQERSNVFTASVGNLEPGQKVEIDISYVALAKHEGTSTRLLIPTVVAPRYVPPLSNPELGLSDQERYNSARTLKSGYMLDLQVDISSPRRILSVDSPSHPIRTQFNDQGAVVTLSHDQVELDSDFILAVEYQDADQPFTWLTQNTDVNDDSFYLMSSFVPHFEVGEQNAELIFVVDCSGSMGGQSIDEAKKALSLCLRSIKEGSFFNIVCFGSSHQFMWPKSRLYTQDTLEEAQKYVNQIQANLGGTEIYSPLNALFQQSLIKGLPRQILLLTDGQVSNETDVIDLCRRYQDQVRLFTFGIGHGVSENLVSQLAKVTGGVMELIHPNERIESKVIRTFKRVHQPHTQVDLKWDGVEVEIAQDQNLSFYSGDRYTLLARLDPLTSSETGHLTITCQEQSWDFPLQFQECERSKTLPSLWATERIRSIENTRSVRRGSTQDRGHLKNAQNRINQALLDLSLKYQLLSSQASFVAVEHRSDDRKTTQPLTLRQVPLSHLRNQWMGSSSPSFGGNLGMIASFASAPSRSAMPSSAMPAPAMTAPAMPASAMPMSPMSSGGAHFFSPPTPSKKRSRRRSNTGAPAHFGSPNPHNASYSSPPPPSAPAYIPPPSPSPTYGASIPKGVPRKRTLDDTAQSPIDSLFTLLLNQQANGSFKANGELIQYFKANALDPRLLDNFKSNEVYITLLIMRIIKKRYAEHQDLWESAFEKGEHFVNQENPSRSQEYQELINTYI